MDISKKKSRRDLQAYFKKNSVPTEDNYKELIEAGLNQHDDGVFKPPGSALCVIASSQDHKPVLSLYSAVADIDASWVMSLAVPGGGAQGFTLSKGSLAPSASDARIFIDSVTGHVGIGTADADHRLTVAGDLSAASADLSGDVHVTGAVTAGSTLAVTGAVTAGSTLGVTGAVTAGSTLGVTGAVTAGSTLAVTGAVTAKSTLSVAKEVTAESTLAVTGAVTAGSTLDVKEALTAKSTLTVAKEVTAGSTLAVTGAVTAGSTLAVTGAVTAGSTLDVKEALTAKSTLTVTKEVTAGSTLAVTGAVTAGSTLAVTGAVTAGSTLDVTGAVSMSRGLDVKSEPRTKENDHPRGRPLYVTGVTDAQGAEIRTSDAARGLGISATTLYAAGTAEVQDIVLKPKGSSEVAGKVQVKGGLEVTGPMLVSSFTPPAGAASPDMTLAASAGGKVNVTSPLRATSTLEVTGAMFASSMTPPAGAASLDMTLAARTDGKVKVMSPLQATSSLDVTGALTAASASVSGAVSAASVTMSGAVSAASASVSGDASVTGTLTSGKLSLGGQQATRIVTTFTQGEDDVSSLPTEKAVRDHVDSACKAAVQAAKPNIIDNMTDPDAASIPTRHAVKQFIDEYFNSVLPDKLILMWHGDEPPPGWVLCDGANGTPDLRDKFVLGAGSAYRWKDEGGAVSVKLEPRHLARHSHSASADASGDHRHTFAAYPDNYEYGGNYTETNLKQTTGGDKKLLDMIDEKYRTTSEGGWHSHSVTVDPFGGAVENGVQTINGEAHENMPPYYVLAFIMRKRNAT